MSLFGDPVLYQKFNEWCIRFIYSVQIVKSCAHCGCLCGVVLLALFFVINKNIFWCCEYDKVAGDLVKNQFAMILSTFINFICYKKLG